MRDVPRPRPKPGAVITAVTPARAGVGDRVTILGSGFGARPARDEAVYVGDHLATVLTWSDTAIVIEVPVGSVAEVCISVLEQVDVGGVAAAAVMTASTDLGAVLSGCFGLPTIGGKLVSGAAAALAPHAECGAHNRVWVGPPSIDTFSLNEATTAAAVRVGSGIELLWRTQSSDDVRLSAVVVSGTVPPAVLPTAPSARPPGTVGSAGRVAPSGALRLGPPGIRSEWQLDYVLTATNAAGSSEARVRATATFEQAVAFLGAGSRSIFHAGALEYLAVACPRAPRVVTSTGLGALGALSAATSFTNVGPLVASWRTINAAPVLPAAQGARMVSVMGHLLAEEPVARQAFEDYQQGMYADLLDGVYAMVNEVMLSYAEAPVVGDVPIAFGDPTDVMEQKMVDALLASGSWVAGKVIGPALESGGVSDGYMGRVTAPAKAFVEEAITNGAVSGAISAVGTALLPVNPIIAVAVVIVGQVIKAIVEGSMTQAQAVRLRTALDSRGLCSTAALGTLFDDFLPRVGLGGGLTVGTSTGVALMATALESGEPAYIDGLRGVRTASGATIGMLPWRDALLAVCAIPGASAPVRSGGVHLVDASLTDTGPIELLLRSRVDEVIVVHATCNLLPRVEPPDDFSDGGFLTLLRRGERVRSASLALTGVAPDHFWKDLPPADGSARPVRHIMPTIALSNLRAYDHEPGLMTIWRDYGYLRAYDVMAPLTIHPGESPQSELLRAALRDRLAVVSDLITGTRETAWRLEQSINRVLPLEAGAEARRSRSPIAMTNAETDLLVLRQLKTLVHSLVERRLRIVQLTHAAYRSAGATWPGAAVPTARFAGWINRYEEHGHVMDNITPIDPTGTGRVTPWLETAGFSSGISVAAATAPVVDPTLFAPLP